MREGGHSIGWTSLACNHIEGAIAVQRLKTAKKRYKAQRRKTIRQFLVLTRSYSDCASFRHCNYTLLTHSRGDIRGSSLKKSRNDFAISLMSKTGNLNEPKLRSRY